MPMTMPIGIGCQNIHTSSLGGVIWTKNLIIVSLYTWWKLDMSWIFYFRLNHVKFKPLMNPRDRIYINGSEPNQAWACFWWDAWLTICKLEIKNTWVVWAFWWKRGLCSICACRVKRSSPLPLTIWLKQQRMSKHLVVFKIA